MRVSHPISGYKFTCTHYDQNLQNTDYRPINHMHTLVYMLQTFCAVTTPTVGYKTVGSLTHSLPVFSEFWDILTPGKPPPPPLSLHNVLQTQKLIILARRVIKNMPFAKFAPALLINIDHSSRQYDQFLCLDNIIQGERGGGGGYLALGYPRILKKR